MLDSTIKIHYPGKLVFGNGCFEQLQEELILSGAKKILFITIAPLLEKLLPLQQQLQEKGIEVITDVSVIQEPSFNDFLNLMKKIQPENPDVVVGIGGGSVLDIAKLVAAQLDNPQSLEEYVGIGLLKGRVKKLICLPATAGTGSEVSPNAILVDNENQKKGIISPFLVPDSVYVDPLLTLSVPPAITAATGIDALTHCLEAYINVNAHPLIDVYAFEGMQLIAGNIVKAVQDGNDMDARKEVAMGSLLGGFCLGPVNTAAVHALSYPLGSMFHLPHGLSNALLLPYIMEYNIPVAAKRYAGVAKALGCKQLATEDATALAGVEKIKAIIKDCGLPARLSEVGITEAAIPAMAADALKVQRLLKNNPRAITINDAIDIYTTAL